MGGKNWRAELAKSEAYRKTVDDDPPLCLYCSKKIPAPRRYLNNIAYCTPAHRDEARKERHKQRATEERAQTAVDAAAATPFREDQIRRGNVYDRVRAELSDIEWDNWIDRLFSDAYVAKRIKSTAQAVGNARRAAFNDRLAGIAAENFNITDYHQGLLGPSDSEMQNLLAQDAEAFKKRLSELVAAFVEWRTEFFATGIVDDVEVAYLTKEVHKRWIAATLETIYTGGRTLILSPPRHGKTDLLIHFCVWLICRNPHIRILWVGPNSDIGELALGAVRDLLETHQRLGQAYLGEGQSWAPQKRGGNNIWQQTKFTVANRTIHRKQPTMWATGVKGKILSLDADFIIVDDPADPDDSFTPGGREKILNWFKVKLISRKMDHTGLVMISSRVHPDDLYSNYIESDQWSVLVDQAHDPSICHKDIYAEHTNDDCVLFPEVNPLRYLLEQLSDVGAALFDMMYQNKPRPDGTLIYDPDIIKEKCVNRSRDIGVEGIPPGFLLVGGLDPAARSTQAAFLWAVILPTEAQIKQVELDPFRSIPEERYFLVDLETQKAGGIEGAARIMREWRERYGCELWVVEETAYQRVFFDDPRIKLLEASGIVIKPHDTQGRNKHDPDFGVAAQAPIFHEGKVDLPYASHEAQRKTDAYIAEMTNFTDDTGRSKRKSDILMASWFPFVKVIRKWRKGVYERRAVNNSETSYPGYQTTDSNELPWGRTMYPSDRSV